MSKIGKISFLLAGIAIISLTVIYNIIGEWVPYCTLALAATIFMVAFAVIWDRRFYKELLTMKTTKHGMNMGVLIILMIAVLGLANYLGAKHFKAWDFSISQSNTLSEQSIQLARNLKEPLVVRYFYKKGVEGNEEGRRLIRDLVKKYQDVNNKVQLDFVEMNERPDLTSEYGADKGSGVVFLEYKGRRNRLERIDEQEFTNALVKVTREKETTIYFTIGHGEKRLDDKSDALGLGSLKVMLDNHRYHVKTLPLSQQPKIPADADVIVIAGPTQNFQDFEISALEQYLKDGGSIFMALESNNTVGLEKIVSKLGVKFENDYVLNLVETVLGSGVNQGPTMGAVFSDQNKITKGFGRGEVTVFRYPMSLKLIGSPAGTQVEELVKTGGNAMSFASLNLKDQGPQGSFALVDSITGKMPGSEKNFAMIVAGDVDFMTNQMLLQNLNRDLVLNSLASLAKEDDLISITPKDVQATQMLMTETKFTLFLFGFVIPVPIILLGISVGLYMKRRNA